MTAAYQIPPNPNGVDLFTVGPSRAGRLVNPSVTVGFTYGYSRCPASRDLSGDSRMIVSSYYLSAYGPSAWAALGRPFRAEPMYPLYLRCLAKDEGQAQVHDKSHFCLWNRRFHPFNVYTEEKRREKLDYMHNNPVKRGLASSPGVCVTTSLACHSEESVSQRTTTRRPPAGLP
jgi:hypothetical protein